MNRKEKTWIDFSRPPGSSAKTKVIFVLDKSGSMERVRYAAIDSFNEQLDTLQEKSVGRTDVSMITFNHHVDILFESRAPQNVRKLDTGVYQPSGTTALLDALNKAMDIGSTAELGPEDAVLVIVVSDGLENASRARQSDVVERIQRLEATNKWTFTFMCANVDITKIQQDFGVSPNNTFAFTHTNHGTRKMSDHMSAGLGGYMNSRLAGETAVADFYSPPDTTSKSKSDKDES